MEAALMGKTRLPFAPGAVREYLKNDADFLAVIPAQLITTRSIPKDILQPFATVRSSTTTGKDAMLRDSLVQVDIWVPKAEILQKVGIDADPEEVAWDIAGLAGEILGRARNVHFRNCAWSGDWKDGPMNLIDETRGKDLPLYRSPVRVELTMRMVEAPTFTWALP